MRETLGLSVRAVEAASIKIAERHANQDYLLPISRLSDIETKGVLPNLYRLYSLSVIYRVNIQELLRVFNVPLNDVAADIELSPVSVTHGVNIFDSLTHLRVPTRIDPSFDPESTVSIGRMIVSWGTAPLSYLKKFADNRKFTYGFVGESDWTMYPLILPGSFLQVDESKTKITGGPWRSEYERQIYFLETRQGFTCCWCELNGRMLTLKPHPMSPVQTRILRIGDEVEVLGQVVAFAMRLDRRDGTELPK
jgi:hypothetical protein